MIYLLSNYFVNLPRGATIFREEVLAALEEKTEKATALAKVARTMRLNIYNFDDKREEADPAGFPRAKPCGLTLISHTEYFGAQEVVIFF